MDTQLVHIRLIGTCHRRPVQLFWVSSSGAIGWQPKMERASLATRQLQRSANPRVREELLIRSQSHFISINVVFVMQIWKLN